MTSRRSQHIAIAVTNDLVTDQRMHRISGALAEAGYRVTLIGRRLDDSPPVDTRPYQVERLSVAFDQGPSMYAAYNLALYRHLVALDIDLLYAVDLDTVVAVERAASHLAIPWVYDAHEYFTQVPELAGKPIKKAIWHQLGLWALPRAAACLTVNDSLAKILGGIYRCSFEVVRNVPEYHPSSARVMAYPLRLIYQGVLNQGRWIDHYIDILSDLPANVELHLYGHGDLSADLRQRARQSPRMMDIYFHGRLSPNELRAETSKAWLGLNMLDHSSLNYYYSLANKFFDYMHAGIPSINSRLPEYLALLDQAPVGVTVANDRRILTETILHLYNNPAAHEQMATAATAQAKSYSWQVDKIKLVQIIDKQLRR